MPHLTLEEEKAKNRLSFPPVLAKDKNPKTSTNHQIQIHSCWGRTIKRSITSLTMWIPQCTDFPGCLCEAPECPHTSAQLFCSCTSTAVQLSSSGTLLVIWILSYEHGSRRKQEILCVHSTLSYYFWLSSGLLLCLTGAQQLDWQQASPHSWHLPSQCTSRQEVRRLLLH